MTKKELIAKIHDYFADKKEVVAVYLYGSYARNEHKSDSDIDLAVLFLEKSSDNLGTMTDYSIDLEKLLTKEVEIQELNAIGIEIGKRIISEGLLLIDNDH